MFGKRCVCVCVSLFITNGYYFLQLKKEDNLKNRTVIIVFLEIKELREELQTSKEQ